jgi:hypothetical protein
VKILNKYKRSLARHGGINDIRARVKQARDHLAKLESPDQRPANDRDEEMAAWLVDMETLLSLHDANVLTAKARRDIIHHAVRWANNMIVEAVHNHGKALNEHQHAAIKKITAAINNYMALRGPEDIG